MRILLALCFTIYGSVVSAADLITKPSPHSVAVTIDKLAAAVENAGAKVFARVDHAKGAMSVDTCHSGSSPMRMKAVRFIWLIIRLRP